MASNGNFVNHVSVYGVVPRTPRGSDVEARFHVEADSARGARRHERKSPIQHTTAQEYSSRTRRWLLSV